MRFSGNVIQQQVIRFSKDVSPDTAVVMFHNFDVALFDTVVDREENRVASAEASFVFFVEEGTEPIPFAVNVEGYIDRLPECQAVCLIDVNGVSHLLDLPEGALQSPEPGGISVPVDPNDALHFTRTFDVVLPPGHDAVITCFLLLKSARLPVRERQNEPHHQEDQAQKRVVPDLQLGYLQIETLQMIRR